MYSARSDTASHARAAGTLSQGAAGTPLPPQAAALLFAQPPAGEEARLPSALPHEELLLMAVPKRKVTPSRKGIRTTGKHLRFVPVVSRCATCGRVKQQHWHCPHCMGGRGAAAEPEAPAAEGGAGGSA